MKKTCIIVEDEPLALEKTKSFVLRTPQLELLDYFENALDALKYIESNPVDLIFLDIQMDELTGIEFLESIDLKCDVIFTTAHPEYALKGFDLNIIDYLLKPFSYNRFIQAINKLEKKITKPEYLFVKSGYQLEKISFSAINFIEGMGDYRGINTLKKKILTLKTFSDLIELLPKTEFIRVHKSYVVAISKIDNIESNIISIGTKKIPISATYKNHFFQTIKAH